MPPPAGNSPQKRRAAPAGGLWIAFMGPDGCGKTSVIDACIAEFAPLFRGVRRFHFRPALGGSRSGDDKPVTDPHELPPRGRIASALKLAYYATDFVLGYLFSVRPALARSWLVCFDRYYHDLLLDKRRYRYGGPDRPARVLARLIPAPDLFIFLDAPGHVLQSRKAEVSPAESSRQRDAYRAMADKLDRSHVVDASRPLAQVVADVHAIVYDCLAGRVRRLCDEDR